MANAKICGLSTPEAVDAALIGGAAFVGFNFFPRSPRYVDPPAAARLADPLRGRAGVVAVTVDPSDALVDEIMATLEPDVIQLHGKESPARAMEIRARTGARILKALPVSSAEDLASARAYEGAVDLLMFDARAPEGAVLPGGNGAMFDWSLMAGRSFKRPWFLAGGLDPSNVAAALQASGAHLVDVSSGVESAPGCKDPALIAAFLEAVRRA